MATTPKERWIELKAQMQQEIDKIDKDTPWQVIEPAWWLEMREIEKIIINSDIK